ncbi:MAG: hypothetical protein DCF20_04225 [Pseudanabaena sp.]|nr:MAG: hypothetical protein DCF20_04225 [Pseudanabaena sp.]
MEKTNDVLKFAKQGNPKAIEAIFNKQLSASNIAVKAVVRDGCLQILFEAKQALSQVTMVNGVKKILTGLKPENIQTVKVYSKQSGDDFPKWHEEFELAEKKKVDVSPNIDLTQPEAPKPSETIIPTNDSNESPSQVKNRATESPQLIDTNAKSHVNDLTNNLTSPNIADEDSLLMEKARWGYLDSISTLLNSAFNGQGISASLNKPRAKFLEIVLKSNDIIDKQIAIEIICRILNKTKTRVFNEISVFVDTSESDFPSWNQNLIFKDNQFTEKEDVVVSSPDSDVFSHLAKFVIEAKDNIGTRINSKLNSLPNLYLDALFKFKTEDTNTKLNTGDTNTLKTAGAIVIAGIVLFGLFQWYRSVEYETKFSELREKSKEICKRYEDFSDNSIRKFQEASRNGDLPITDADERQKINQLESECKSSLNEMSSLTRAYKGY